MLDVDLAGLVAREREIHAAQYALLGEVLEIRAIKEVAIAPLVAEEEPVAAACARGFALLQECAEGRDAGARPYHDDRRRRIGGQAKAVRSLHEHRNGAPRFQVFGDKARADPLVGAIVHFVAQHADREVRLVLVLLRRRSDGIEPRLHAPQRGNEIAYARARGREFDQHVEYVMYAQALGLRIVFGELAEPRAIGLVLRFAREQLVEHFAGDAQVAFGGERLAR